MKPLQKLALAAADFCLVLAAIVIALGLRKDFDWNDMVPQFLWSKGQLTFVLGLAAATVVSFYLHGLYEKVWRYAGTHELVGVVRACILSFIPFQAIVMVYQGHLFPRSALALTLLVTVNICGGIRLLLRLASETMGRPITSTRVIIVGANDAGEAVVRDRSRKYIPVGFVDDRPDRAGIRIHGIQVQGQLDDLPRLVDSQLVTEVVLAAPPAAEVRRVMELLAGKEVKLRVIPAMQDLVAGKVELARLRQLSIEDLLEREPIKVDPELIRPLLAGKRILITGAGGSIGSEIARQVSRFGPEKLLLVGRGENSLYEIGLELPQATLLVCDVCRERILERIFEEHRPHFVFHAAAHKHVPLMEAAPAEAVYTNVFGTRAVLDACRKYGVERFILLSTDKAVNPNNVMGATKRMAEKLVAQLGHPGYAAVRFGNVLGSRGSVVPTMQKQILQGGPVTVTDPAMTRYFMTIPEAVTLVLQASGLAQGGEIYLLDMGKPVRILDLAHNLIRLCGFEPDKDIPIKITGCRPGEKLEEQLVGVGESTEPTRLSKVSKVITRVPGPAWPGELLEELRQHCLNGDQRQCRALLLKLLERAEAQGESSPRSEAS
ncbi:MAG: polysaccharide biosynthesis protein [Candidatus Eremiobacteraeota bacterium]|nr:polysaccharide biosynthesis protein [Candidatus Eremiobacteraeota bacterium]